MDSQEPSPTKQFKSINPLALSLLYGPTLTSIHNYWKNHSFDYMDLCWESNVSAFYMLCRFVMALFPRSKCLLTSYLQVTICSAFGAQENKPCHCFHCFLIYFPWIDGTRWHDLTFCMLSFKPAFSLSSFSFKRHFSSSWLSALRVVSSAYWGYWYFSPQPWLQLVLHPAPHFAWCTCI